MSKPKRMAIVEASLELIAAQGFHGATMALIADRAGVAAGTIYCYFPSKEILIAELYLDVKERITKHISDGYALEKSLRERFHHLGVALLHYFIATPPDFRFMESYYNSPYGVALRRDSAMGRKGDRNLYGDIFNEGVAAEAIKDLPAAILFSLTFGPLLEVARDHIFNNISLDDLLVARVVEATWDCISC